MSQNTQILKHLQSGKSITPMDALRKFQCFRLAARIADLRQAGHNIHAELEKKEDKRYARYSLG